MQEEEVKETLGKKLMIDWGKAWKRVKGRTNTSLSGLYYSPNAGGCLCAISKTTFNCYVILGAYGHGENKSPGMFWSAQINTSESCDASIPLTVTFHGKELGEGVSEKKATFHVSSKTIEWEDGSVWVPMYFNRRQFIDDVCRHEKGSTLWAVGQKYRLRERRRLAS